MNGRRLPQRAAVLAALVVATAVAGCIAPDALPPRPTALAPASVEAPEGTAAAPSGLPGVGVARGRFALLDDFVVDSTRFTVAAFDTPARGVPGAPVELASAGAAGNARLVRDDWVFVVTLGEANAARPGVYEARLEWNGRDAGVVRFAQRAPEAERESVTLAFGIGPELASSAVYVLTITPVDDAPGVEVVLASTPNGNLTWTGEGAHAGVVAPVIKLDAGRDVVVRIVNADAGFHNLVVVDAAGAVVAGPSANLAAPDDEATLAWHATPGTFAYVCRYHTDTMRGVIEVA